MYLKCPGIPILIIRLQISFYLILLFLCLLLSFLLFRGGRLSLNFFIYQPPTISCNNDCGFLWNRWFRKFNWDYLKHIFHRKKYILQHFRTLCSKACIQQLMEYTVALSETNAYVVEFNGIV